MFTTAGMARTAMSANECGGIGIAAATERFPPLGRSFESERNGSAASHRNTIPAVALATIHHQCRPLTILAEKLVIGYTVSATPFSIQLRKEQTARHRVE
jgi:hypothetical protein